MHKSTRLSSLLIAPICTYLLAVGAAWAQNPSANLDQYRNGAADSPINTGTNWVNGNAGAQNSHYVEGMSVPYRVVMTNLPTGTNINLTLGYDIKESGKHAIDFLTHFNRLEPHVPFGHAAELLNPTAGVSGISATTTTRSIPAPDVTNSPVLGQPATDFNGLLSNERLMTLFGGTITNITYVSPQGDLTANQAETRIIVTFTVNGSTAVLAWGGHIASRLTWGFTANGEPRSAGGISGSPYHMRLVGWNLGNLGNQDRSLAAGAVAPPCDITGPDPVCEGATNLVYQAPGGSPSYLWSLSGNGLIVGPNNSPSVNVTASTAGTFTLSVTVGGGGISSTCPKTVTVNPKPVVTTTGGQLTCANPQIQISATSSIAGSNFIWSGPGIVSGGNTATPTVNQPGSYTVTVTSPAGCSAQGQVAVTQNIIPPNVNAGPDKLLNCTITSVTLNGSSSTTGATASWTGPNNFTSALFTPTVIAPGIYTLTVTGPNGCTANDEMVVNQDISPPNVSAGLDKLLNCTITSVTLNGSSATVGATASWSGPNNFTSVSFTPTVSVPGTYTLTVTGPNGCIASDEVVVNQDVTLPNVSAGSDKLLNCTITSVTLNGSSLTAGATASWSGPNNFTSTLFAPTVSAPGTYTLTITGPNGCIASDDVIVNQDVTLPNVSAGPDQLLNCTITSVRLNGSSSTTGATASWSGPNNFTSALFSPIVSAPGTYTLTVTGPNGCTANDEVVVNQDISPPSVSAGPDKLLNCTITSVTLNASSSTPGVTYQWSGPGLIILPGPSITVTEPGTYTLTVTAPNGCSVTDQVVVNQDISSPNVNAGLDKLLNCTITSVTLNGFSSTPVATASWSGPNGFTSTSFTPIVSVPGNYTLTVTGPNGCTASDVVVVNQDLTPPNVDAGADKLLNCTITSVTLNGSSSTTGATASWSGPINFTSDSFTPTVSAPGTYTLTVTGPNGCTDSDVVVVLQDVAQPNANAGADKLLNCTITSVTLNGSTSTAGASASWSGPNNFASTSLTPSVSAPGTYTLTVMGPNGCTATDVVVVIQDISPPNANAGLDKLLNCTITSVTLNGFSSTAGATASWSGPNGFTSTSFTPSVSAPGAYTLTVTGPNGCTANDIVTVNQDITLPNVSAGLDKLLNCTITSVTLIGSSSTASATASWSGPNNFVSALFTPSVNAPGTYILTVTGPNGCTASDEVVVNQDITPPNVDAGADKLLNCTITSVTLNGSSSTSGATALWSGPGNFTSDSFTPTVSAPGAYTLTVTGPNGCTDSDVVVVNQDIAQPNANAGPDKLLNCTITSVTLNGSSSTAGATASWSGPNNFASTSFTPSVSAPGTYTLTVTGLNGCTANDVVVVIQDITVPNVNAGPDKLMNCTITSVILSGSSSTTGATASWSGPNNFTSISFTPSVSAPGTYTLTVTGPNGCTASDEVLVNQNITTPDVSAGPDKLLNCTITSVTLNGSSSSTGATASWSGPNSFTSASFTPTVSAPGTYTLTVTGPNGCTASDEVLVNQNIALPNVSAGPDKQLNCTITSVTLNGSSSTADATASWSGPNNFTSASFTPTVSSPGPYVLTVTGPNGCTDSDVVEVHQDVTLPDASAGPDKLLNCTITSIILNGSSSTAGATASWSGPNDFSSTLFTPSVSVPGTYTLTVTGPNGCTATDAVTINQDLTPPSCMITQPAQPPVCGSTGNTLAATTSVPLLSLVWSIDPPVTGWSITGGQGTNTITYTAGNSGSATFKLEVTSNNGCKSSCTLPVICTQPPLAFCTFTQGAYGNAGGKFNGETTLQILQRLITSASSLVVGKPMPGARSVTVQDGAEQCIINRLPAGGTPAQLMVGHFTMTLANSCNSGQPVGSNGRWRNVLLGQTVTLSLNVRFDTDLGGFELCPQFKTQRALPGPNGWLGDSDDRPDPSDPGETYAISQTVLNALTTVGLPKTVNGLLDLANRGLAGQAIGGASLANINGAVDAINRSFDGCRFLICCNLTCPSIFSKEAEFTASEYGELPAKYTLEAFPNPFNPSTQVQYDLPEQTFVTVKAYNVLGQEVMTLVDHVEHEAGSYAVRFDASRLTSGVYILRLQTAHYTMTRKILFAR